MQSENLCDVIWQFLNQLPDTIKESILQLIWFLYPGRSMEDLRSDTLEAIFYKIMHSDSVIDRVRAVIIVSALIDYVLFVKLKRAPDTMRIAELLKSDDEKANREIERMKLRAPLYERHLDKAYADWKALKERHLSLPQIADFQGSLRVE